MDTAKIVIGSLFLMSATLMGANSFAKPTPRIEPLPPGCQDLESLNSKPIKLQGKVYGTYLPDGRRYNKRQRRTPPDYFEVGVLDLNEPSPKIRRLTKDGIHDAEIRVSSDGSKMVWTRRPLLDHFEEENTIVMAKTNMSGYRVLAHGLDAYYGIPSFADLAGEIVMFSKQGENDDFTKLVFFDLKTSKMRTLRTRFRGSISDPQMSPDGKKITFKSFEQKDNTQAQIYIMNADGTRVRRLTKNQFKDEDPAFSPDGRTIAFERAYDMTSHQGQHSDDYYFQVGIVSLDLATGRETQLTELDPCGKNELWLPTWSPNGELIMFTRGLHLENGDFTHDLWVMRKDGSDLQKVPGSDGIMFFDWVY